jgi:hypothetical protein
VSGEIYPACANRYEQRALYGQVDSRLTSRLSGTYFRGRRLPGVKLPTTRTSGALAPISRRRVLRCQRPTSGCAVIQDLCASDRVSLACVVKRPLHEGYVRAYAEKAGRTILFARYEASQSAYCTRPLTQQTVGSGLGGEEIHQGEKGVRWNDTLRKRLRNDQIITGSFGRGSVTHQPIAGVSARSAGFWHTPK